MTGKEEMVKNRRDVLVWKAKRSGILSAIRSAAAKMEDTGVLERELEDHYLQAPEGTEV